MKENEKIKHIRKKLSITQQELATILGVSKQYLSKVEKKQNKIYNKKNNQKRNEKICTN